MLLYIVRDRKNNTFSQLMFGPNMADIINSFTEINPSNLKDLELIHLGIYENIMDFITQQPRLVYCHTTDVEKIQRYPFIDGETILSNLDDFVAEVTDRDKELSSTHSTDSI